MARSADRRIRRKAATIPEPEVNPASSELPPLDHNQPTPLEAFKAHVDDLWSESVNFLDGEEIATEGQAEAVTKLRNQARDAERDGDVKRKELTKPLDEAKAVIMDEWRPLIDKDKGRCRLIVDTCNKVLAPWLKKKEDEQKAIAEAARLAAEEKAAEALRLHQESLGGSLEDRERAEQALTDANRAKKAADRAERAKPQVGSGGMGRSAGLRSVWRAEIADRRAALKFYLQRNPQDFVDLIQHLASEQARNGPRVADGIEFKEDRATV